MTNTPRRARFLLPAVLFLAGCGAKPGDVGVAAVEETRAPAPPKLDVDAYIGSGTYMREIAEATTAATKWIGERAARRAPGERLVAIFDVDETAVSNLPNLRIVDPARLPPEWRAWAAKGIEPPIAPVLEAFKAVRRAGVDVIFLTGRSDQLERASTERDLRAVGYEGFARVVCNPNDGSTATTGEFKIAARKKLAAEGWTIIATIGDQESDLAGGYAERTFKLPNPFYTTK